MDATLFLKINFAVYSAIFISCLIKNFNFNIILVGLTYLVPLVPLGMTENNIDRFIIVSFCNMTFGIIEVVFFVLTERPDDITFGKAYFQQLWGHVLPIVAALVGMSFYSRMTREPVTDWELSLIALIFIFGSVLRVWSILQLGVLRFKFNIVFREKQTLKIDGLHGFIRHPTYTAMMLVVLAYAITTHSWLIGAAGIFSALFGFQYRIYYEEIALKEQFGEEYDQYRARTPMWLPSLVLNPKRGRG
jgi:protein-S-isoprenylcysteine O-methyltransferase Ste14